jgi:hypothetical protein
VGNARNSASPAIATCRNFITIFAPPPCTAERLGQAACLDRIGGSGDRVIG